MDTLLLSCAGVVMSCFAFEMGMKYRNKLAVRLGLLGIGMFIVTIIFTVYLYLKHGVI
jgi:hypothetical protein